MFSLCTIFLVSNLLLYNEKKKKIIYIFIIVRIFVNYKT